ncbi:MAG TPA: galactosyltransferase-related protein [Longimicrobiales bacterium]|nr:galactosyltransferase-related protein [Longimicrobiales bacterium]
MTTPRRTLGAALIDWPAWERNLHGLRGGHWTRIGNRNDRLRYGPGGRGVACEGRWTSRLHGSEVFPSLGRRLMERAVGEWPPAFSSRPQAGTGDGDPEVSFVIGHRGLDRLPLLAKVLESVAAQEDTTLECVVVEQSEAPEIDGRIPGWARHLHTPVSRGTPYSRAWAFNVGARAARGRLLVFHDNDMIVPRRYAAELLARRAEGYEVINLKRFVFYLDERATADGLAGGPPRRPPQRVIQNLEGGGSLALDRDAFFALGGFDEAFVGWGGEDNEFWERAQVRAAWPWGYLPILHLHHREQPGKGHRRRRTASLLDERSAIPPEVRVAELTGRCFGRVEGPDPPFSAATAPAGGEEGEDGRAG